MTDGADQEETGQVATSDGDRRQFQATIEFPDRRSGIDRRTSARSLAAQQDHDAAIAVARKALLDFGLSSAEFAAAQSATTEARLRLAAADAEEDEVEVEADEMPTTPSAWISPLSLLPPGLERESNSSLQPITITLSAGLRHRLAAYATKHGVTQPVAIRSLLRQALDRD